MTTDTATTLTAARNAENLPDFLTVAELAEYLQVSVHTIYYWRTQGEGPAALHVGKHLRFPKNAVLDWTLAQVS